MVDAENIIATQIVNVVFLEHLKNGKGDMKNRKWNGFSFCAHGHIVFYQGNEKIDLTPGSAVLLPQDSEYSWECQKSGLYPQINFFTDHPMGDKIVKFELGGYQLFDKKLRDIQNALLTASNAKAMSVFYDVLDNMVRRRAPLNHILSKSIDYLTDNYSDASLSNKTLANQADISEVYFRKLFKDLFGVSPKQYILNLRIKKACELLTESRFNINEIAEKCGFSSVYHFCRAFKNHMSVTPTEYAKSNRNHINII